MGAAAFCIDEGLIYHGVWSIAKKKKKKAKQNTVFFFVFFSGYIVPIQSSMPY